MFQNAGEKGDPHRDPADPPRRRANQRKGKGTMANDRPPVQGVVGRGSGQIRLTVCEDTRQDTVQPEAGPKPGRARRSRRASRRPTTGWRRPGAGTAPCAIRGASTPGQRRRRGAGSPLQHQGGHLDGAAQFPAAFPGRPQEIPRAIRCDVPVGAQPQARDRSLAQGPHASTAHLLADMSDRNCWEFAFYRLSTTLQKNAFR